MLGKNFIFVSSALLTTSVLSINLCMGVMNRDSVQHHARESPLEEDDNFLDILSLLLPKRLRLSMIRMRKHNAPSRCKSLAAYI